MYGVIHKTRFFFSYSLEESVLSQVEKSLFKQGSCMDMKPTPEVL